MKHWLRPSHAHQQLRTCPFLFGSFALPKPLLVLDLWTGGGFDLGLILACHYSKNT
ncbi:hypothetical protein PAHAL_5G034200 [Panicum hallii]|uniref:Uncharacterized protein n=1 Tax=Panicum hallii TaxID=206008 RepID=A0A2T8IIR6_9POAL|nr:hypothetical protein PAHAL_5G034200 [Panicum hallii]